MNELVDIVSKIANKSINKNHIKGPLGVRGRNSDNRLIKLKLNWSPTELLKAGIKKTYKWYINNIQ